MLLPFEISDLHIHQFVEFWETQRSGLDIPEWDPLIAMRAMAPVMPFISMVDVKDPPALIVRYAGGAMRTFLGYEPTGRDILEVTDPQFRQRRFRRASAIVSTPCGALFATLLPGATGVEAFSEGMWLPYRRRQSSDLIIISYHGVQNTRDADSSVPRMVQAADAFAYIDLGSGTPSRDDDPEALQPDTGDTPAPT